MSSMKVLLAEDDPITREILKESLQQWGYDVVLADNGVTAWEMLQEKDSPRMAVLDWQMPGLTGLEICERLRSRKQGAYVYVIMLTGLSEKIHVIQGLEAGADDYLTKPCNPYELRVRMHAGKRILQLESDLLAALSQMKDLVFVDESKSYESQLTGRELEILRLAAAGKNNQEIAKTFHLSPDWVMAHFENIMQKMGVHTPQDAINKATQDGVLSRKTFV